MTAVFKKLVIGIILNAGALYGVTYLLPEITYTGGVLFFIVGGVVMGILNTFIKPILKLLTLPIHILTVGISLIFLNALIFWIFDFIIDTIVVEGVSLTVSRVKMYFFAGIVFGLVNWFEHLLVRTKK